MDKLRCLVYNQRIKKHCDNVLHGKHEDTILEIPNLQADVLGQLLKDIDDLPFRQGLRITSTSDSLRIRVLMPSSPHEAVGNLSLFILDAYRAATPGHAWSHDIMTLQTACQTNQIPVISKEPDWSLRPRSRGGKAIPSVIMEVGLSESMVQLEHDKDEWFQFAEVITVILVKIWVGQITMTDAVEILVWTRGPNQVPFKRTTWKHDFNSPHVDNLVLYASDFFNPAEMPAHLNGATVFTIPSADLVQFMEMVHAEV